ncbi:MAG TPA: two-component regulator propeller domain-containing protein [Steroidobacteraceae bacterium]|nr:two-component regulator propeller domain-containing protein [Steroidobacteraceae bacterium]
MQTPVNTAASPLGHLGPVGIQSIGGAGRSRLPAIFFALVAACAAALACATDSPPLILEHLTIADGLPQGTVMSTLQDSQGFVWIGTEDGLMRYDGHELHRYAFSRTDPNGLPGNFIRQIAEDAHHDLWVAIKGSGIARWNRARDTFTLYRHADGNPASLANDIANTLLIASDGAVWVGMDGGLDRLDPATGLIRHFSHDVANADSLADDHVFTLAQDGSGTLWVGTRSGLDRWRTGTAHFDHFRHGADPHSLSGNEISAIAEDRNQNLWVATYDAGLNRMTRAGVVEQQFRHDPHRASSLVSDDVSAVLEDQAGHLWVGTADGLDLLDRGSGEFSHYASDERDAESLRDSYIMSLYEDGAGLMWIGTRSGGVSRWNPRSWEFGGHRPDWLKDRLVTALADAPDNRVWVGSIGGGLVRFDADTGQSDTLDALLRRPNALGDPRVMSLRLDRRGTLWIGTMTKGLFRLTASGQLSHVDGISNPGIMSLFEARSGAIWVGTHGGGANIVDPVTGAVRQLPYGERREGALDAANVTSIAEDPHGNFWIGTDGGLNLTRPDGTVIKVYRHDTANLQSLPSNNIYAVSLDLQGRVWIATDGGGIARVEGSANAPDAVHFRVYTREQGLSSDTIYGLLADSSGRIWLSGNSGLMRLDPDTGIIKTYHREHGLQGEEFNFGAYFRLRDGRLAFGGPGGFNVFDPARLTENRQSPRLALTNVEVMGVPVLKDTPPWLRDHIELDYQAGIVSLDFGALDFTSPKRNRIAYRMAGLTDKWIDLGTQRRITLTNLEAGDHVLEVRAANSDSVWSTRPLTLTLHRDPAPWRSPWAYAGYVLLALVLIAYRVHLQRVKFRRIVEAQRRLESEVASRTHELRESNRQLEEAARAKSNFLDRMSHELRTPMNGVLGMTELLARTGLNSTQSRLAQTIRNSSQVLLQIVNDLLDLSKVQAGKVALEELPIDLAGLVEECAALFAGSAESKGLELVACPPARADIGLLGDPLRIRQIVMNLIGNAVKFTTQGEVTVKADIVAVENGGATVQIAVTDTGIGMDARTIDRIFEPFTQADESTTRKFGGSGLGLAICRELAQLMKGTIGVESRPQVGSTFRLTLPLKIAAQQPTASARPLPGYSVRILTRRPSLAEALARHADALGLPVVHDLRNASGAQRHEILVVDAGSEHDLARLHTAQSRLNAPMIVVASAAENEARSLALLFTPECIVAKPVQRDALREALLAATRRETGPTGATADTAHPPAPAIALRGHVLLVEDEPVNAAVAEGYLTALGCSLVWVKDGAEAVARNAAERFDLILMDLSMPTLDGFATTDLIRQQAQGQARVPIVALTAHDASYYRTCIDAGMDDMLTKPYSIDQCRRILETWLPDRAAETPQATRETLATVDRGAVAKLRTLGAGPGEDIYRKLVDLFRESSRGTLQALQQAVAAGNLRAAGAQAHKVAGSSGNVGALSFSADARRLEKSCAAGELAEVQQLNARLQAAWPALMAALEAHCLADSA